MRSDAYADNPAYNLLINILIRYRITELENKEVFQSLSNEAQKEIDQILKINAELSKTENPTQRYSKLNYQAQRSGNSTNFPSLFDIATYAAEQANKEEAITEKCGVDIKERFDKFVNQDLKDFSLNENIRNKTED